MKVLVGGVWAWGVASLLVPIDSIAPGLGRLAFGIMAAAHAIECAVFLPRLRRAPGSLLAELLQTFLFGFLHVREIPAAPEPDAPAG